MDKFFYTPLKKRLTTLWVPRDELDKWFSEWQLFFMLGFGRSGTAFLAHLLNQPPAVQVFHEPVLEDFYAHLRAHYSLPAAVAYIGGFRKKEIYMRMRHATPAIYGEVNGLLRCHAQAIQKVFPQAVVLHLVRDGRDVVRSTMPRRTMTLRNPFSMMIHPMESDPWRERWSKMDRFARICWFWQEENARLRKAIRNTVQFEKLLSSFDYFHDCVLQPCHITMQKAVWEESIRNPLNVTAKHQMPKWQDWSPEQKKTFLDICGEEMAACGYSI